VVPIIDALEVMKCDTVGDKTATHRLQAMQMKMHYPSRATEIEIMLSLRWMRAHRGTPFFDYMEMNLGRPISSVKLN
jgi:hypothetical protein